MTTFRKLPIQQPVANIKMNQIKSGTDTTEDRRQETEDRKIAYRESQKLLKVILINIAPY